MSTKLRGDVIMAFIFGGIVGAGLAILFAPASGEETREKISDMEDDMVSGVEDLISQGKDIVSQQKHSVEEAVHAVGREIRNAGKHLERIGR